MKYSILEAFEELNTLVEGMSVQSVQTSPKFKDFLTHICERRDGFRHTGESGDYYFTLLVKGINGSWMELQVEENILSSNNTKAYVCRFSANGLDVYFSIINDMLYRGIHRSEKNLRAPLDFKKLEVSVINQLIILDKNPPAFDQYFLDSFFRNEARKQPVMPGSILAKK